MAADMAKELRPYNIAAVSIWMGPLDTERARAYLATSSRKTRSPSSDENHHNSPAGWSLRCTRRTRRMKLSGHALIGAELGAKLEVTDVDGIAPASYRYEMGARQNCM